MCGHEAEEDGDERFIDRFDSAGASRPRHRVVLRGLRHSTVVVAKDGPGNTIVQSPLFAACGGTTFRVTVELQSGQIVTDTGTAAGGTLKFGGLKDINTGGVVTVEITAISEPGCPPPAFPWNQTFTTGPIALNLARDRTGQPIKDTFIIDADKFHKK